MLVNQVTKKAEQLSRSKEGYWAQAVLSGIFSLLCWLSVFLSLNIRLFDETMYNLFLAIFVTAIFVQSVRALRALFKFQKDFEESPSKFAKTTLPEPLFMSLLSIFYHK